jgi:hypothetical protein
MGDPQLYKHNHFIVRTQKLIHMHVRAHAHAVMRTIAGIRLHPTRVCAVLTYLFVCFCSTCHAGAPGEGQQDDAGRLDEQGASIRHATPHDANWSGSGPELDYSDSADENSVSDKQALGMNFVYDLCHDRCPLCAAPP